MRISAYVRSGVFMIAGVLCAALAGASPIGFTDRAAFDAATSGLSSMNTLDFDSLPVGTVGAGPLQGISFTFIIGGGFDGAVTSAYDTTSGANALGSTGDGTFLAGDSFTMSFAPTQAIGLYVIASDIIFAGDFRLEAAGGSVDNDGSPSGTVPDFGKVFFLGLYDAAAPFSSATLTSNPWADPFADFLFNVDDIRAQIGTAGPGPGPTPSPVPEPASLLLVGSGLLALARRARRRAGSRIIAAPVAGERTRGGDL
jgi:hypothetical protein